MKIEVELLRIDQSWDFDTRQHRNYFVFEFCGIEVRVPCAEEQVAAAITTFTGPPSSEIEEESHGPPLEMETPVEAAPIFAQRGEEEPLPAPKKRESKAERRLAPLKREKGDDAGIAQG